MTVENVVRILTLFSNIKNFFVSNYYMTPYDTSESPAYSFFTHALEILQRYRRIHRHFCNFHRTSLSHTVHCKFFSLLHFSRRRPAANVVAQRSAQAPLKFAALGPPNFIDKSIWILVFAILAKKVLQILHKLTQIRGRVFQFI